MNVLLVAAEYPPWGSGIANVVQALRGYMLKKGLHVVVLSRRGGNINIADRTGGLPGLAGLLSFWQKAVNYISKTVGDYDAVWMHSPMLISAGNLRGIKKLMISFHSTYYGFYRAFRTNVLSRFLPYYCFASRLERSFLRQLAHIDNIIITAVSPSVAEETSRNGLNVLPQVIPNGLEIDHGNTIDRHRARASIQGEFSLQFPKKARLLLYAGRIAEPKRPLLLIDFFEQVSCVNSDIHLIVAGSGNLLRKLKKKAAHLTNVHVVGHITHEKMPIFLKAADAFISLSCYEGLPLTVLEAASLNLPLILSDIPAHRWIVNSGIGYGKLLNLRTLNPIEISEFMECNIKAGRRNVKATSLYKWKNIVEQYLRVLQSLDWKRECMHMRDRSSSPARKQ